MAEKTGIAWCDSTFNPWIGCTKVSPGCDHCYAEALDKRHRWRGATHWGPGVERMRTSESNWRTPERWNRQAGGRHLVFCSSLADVFDNEVPTEWRRDLFGLIARTPRLTWLLLTKRIGNAEKMMREACGFIEPSPGCYTPRPNVWLGASVVNQAEADRDIPKLLETPAAKRFVSYEPALGPINFRRFLHDRVTTGDVRYPINTLDWVIIGGESAQGAPAREFRVEWARDTVRQCKKSRAAVFVKQMGARVVDRNDAGFDGCDPKSWPLRPDGADPEVEFDIHGFREEYQGADCRIKLMDRAGADPAEWPEDLRVQEFPA